MARGWSKSRVHPGEGRGTARRWTRTRRHENPRLSFSLSLSLSVSLCVRHTGVDSVKMISLVTLVESRIDPILISS